MIKKLAAVTAALTIAICSFTSCSKNNDSSSTVSSTVDSSVSAIDSTTEKQTPEPSLTIDGKSIDTKDFIVCTIDGKDIDFDTFRYYYYYTISKYTSTYGATLDTIKSTDGGFELLMEDVITALKQELVAPELAEENGIELTDDDNKTIDDQIAKAKANYDSDEAYLNDLKSAYLTEDLYRKMLETATIYTKVNDTLFKNNGKYATKKEDFKKIVKDTSEYCREIHVMIPFYAQVDLDVRLTKDCRIVVFHDNDLMRMCGIEGKVFDYTYEQLSAFKLKNSDEKIPLLSEVLKNVDGKVPLLIELKGGAPFGELESRVDHMMKKYKGEFAVQSFNPFSVMWFRFHSPKVTRGQLISKYRKNIDLEYIERFICAQPFIWRFISKPQFIAADLRSISLETAFQAVDIDADLLTWTGRGKELIETASQFSKTVIAEQFPDDFDFSDNWEENCE